MDRIVETKLSVERLYGQGRLMEGNNRAHAGKAERGTCVIAQVLLFPGIWLLFHDIHVEQLDYSGEEERFSEDILSIQHCREGRFEGEYADGEFFYLGEGDLAVNLPETSPVRHSFPLSHYHGLNLVVSTGEAGEYLDQIQAVMGGLQIDLENMRRRLQAGNRLVILRHHPSIDHMMEEIYQAQDEEQTSMLKLNVLKLLVYLSGVEEKSAVKGTYFSRTQVQTVKEIQEFLTAHLEEHYTLSELSAKFCIPMTSMKTCFRGVYGMPVNSYMRRYRLQAAAELLRNTELSVGEIGLRVGYESPSKFTEAFKRQMGKTPREYRNIYCLPGTECACVE